MPLDLADALRRHLLQRFPADRDYPRAALHAPAMPPLVAAFLERALDRWLEIEREQLRSDWFDFDAPSVQDAESRFFDVLAQTARVPAEAWKPTLGGAVDLVVRFLTTPARALTDALFEGDSDPLPTPEIRRRLKLFAAYLYFPEVAAAYLDKKQPESLDPDKLFDLLDRIDRRIVREYTPEDWLALLEPLFTLARTVPSFDGVPASLLQRFFQAKGYDEIAEALGAHIGSTVDEDTLRRLLTPDAGTVPAAEPDRTLGDENGVEIEVVKTAETEEDFQTETVEASEETEPPLAERQAPQEVEPQEVNPQEEQELEAPSPADEPVPLWQRYAGSQAAERDERVTDTREDEAEDAPAPLWKRFSRETAPTPAAAASAVSSAPSGPASLATIEGRVLGPTSAGQRMRYVKHLFKGDERAYANVLRALDDAGSWTEASRVIARDVFRPYKVNIYGEHAVAFTDAVEARYRH